MKKLGILSVAFVLALSLSGTASAATYWFSDTIDSWGGGLVAEDYLTLDFDWDATAGSGTHTTQGEFLTAGIDWLNDDGLLDETRTGMNWSGNTQQCWAWPWLPWDWWNWEPPPDESPNNPPAPVPEPSTMILLGMGLVGITAPGRKKILKKK